MPIRSRRSLLVAGAAAVAVTGAVLAPGSAGAAGPAGIPRIVVAVQSAVAMTSYHLPAGFIQFDVHAHSADGNTVEIAKLAPGYTPAQANADINAGFGGNVAAVRRADQKVDFKGGAEAAPGHVTSVTVFLPAGTYYAVNFDSGRYAKFEVLGTPRPQVPVRNNSTLSMLTYGFNNLDVIPRQGLMKVNNISDQPHFLVVQQVKPNTTAAQVGAYFRGNLQTQPPWLLPANTSTGVASPGRTQYVSYNLPAGRYVIACFWPDDDTGMPHAAMGMWKLVTLR